MTEAFGALQRGLLDRLQTTTPEDAASTIVVCPSITFPDAELRKIVGIQFYEERLLCLALLLRRPDLEIVYPTSVPIDDAIVSYYLRWLPDPDDARRRLHLFSVDDARPSALTDKLVAAPHLIAAMRQRVRDPATAFILPFNVTSAEARLSEAMGVPVYGTPPELVWLGSKSGARHVAREAGVAVVAGDEDLRSLEDVRLAIGRIRDARPDAGAVVAKLNNGFSGQGNVVVDVDDVRTPMDESRAVFCASEETWATYGPKVAAEGAVVEELVRDTGTVSPSVQLRILPGNRVEMLSTHDQILGGPDDQVYLGCRFPADPAYRDTIRDEAVKVADVLARRGVIGAFGMDFLVVPDRGVFLSEINLRLGGTTHPFLMARHVTGATYDQPSGQLLLDGEPRVYKASDNEKSRRYVGLSPAVLISAVDDAGLSYDPASGVGTTLHLLGALHDHGKYGLLCIARSHEEADDLYARVVACVDALANG